VDQLFPSGQDPDEVDDRDEWIAIHHARMCEAQERAKTRLEAEALKREHQRPQVNDELLVGTRVFVKNLGVRGRNKIQDRWDPTPYQVVSKPDPRNQVYELKPLTGDGPVKIMNRVNLLRSRELVQEKASDATDVPGAGLRTPVDCGEVQNSARPLAPSPIPNDGTSETESDSDSDQSVILEFPGHEPPLYIPDAEPIPIAGARRREIDMQPPADHTPLCAGN
jgi:hypothetical protein